VREMSPTRRGRSPQNFFYYLTSKMEHFGAVFKLDLTEETIASSCLILATPMLLLLLVFVQPAYTFHELLQFRPFSSGRTYEDRCNRFLEAGCLSSPPTASEH